jgi:hypothetical protein
VLLVLSPEKIACLCGYANNSPDLGILFSNRISQTLNQDIPDKKIHTHPQ